MVGISAEGDKIGRSGQLCLLVVGCRRVTYVFDIFKLGDESFSKGLRTLLADCYILKVTQCYACFIFLQFTRNCQQSSFITTLSKLIITLMEVTYNIEKLSRLTVKRMILSI